MAFIRITVLELFYWGNGSRPVRWSAIQALLASYSGASTWTGLKFYGRFDDAGFRRIVLLLLLVSGISLIPALAIPTRLSN